MAILRVMRHGNSGAPAPHYYRPRWRRQIKRWIKKLFVAGLYAALVFCIYIIGAFAWYSRSLPDPNKLLERNVAQSTKIYDREGETVLYDVHGAERRTLVKLSDVPEYMKGATISAEDRYFYEHGGFNVFAMFKGVIVDPLLGRRARGGSTLTQQFVKNSILTNERRISRKIKEFILSYRIEKLFSKDEILQMYLNEIPYGSVSYGVQSAAQTYFNKDVQDISLAQAAVLAALPKAPSYYSPYGSHRDDLIFRQQYILDQMVETGYITKEQAETAKKEKLEFAVKRESIIAPHFVMYIKEQLSRELGAEYVETGGLNVITTLDLEKQKMAEEAVVAGVEKKSKQFGFKNAALLSLDPANGQILAMVGSKDYFDTDIDGNVNVTTSLRQPGSSIKPLVYLAAFQKGYAPDTVLYDVDTIFKTETKDYHPANYDGKQHGPVTMRQALAGSLNIPAVKTLYLVGVQSMIDVLEMFGYTTFDDRSRFGLSLTLGGGEVKLIEHAAAYAALANGGVYNPPVGILRVEDGKGNVLMEFKQAKRKAIDQKYVDTLNSVLSDDSARTYVFGAGGPLTLPGRPAAAKTGTTNDYKDAWAMGFTPNLVAGVWVGNNDSTEMKKGADGSVIAAPIWNDYMKKATAKLPVVGFAPVEKEVTGKAALDGDVSAAKAVKIDKYSGKLATDLTPASAVIEKKFKDAHCILHYVYKDDPRGGAPSDPAKADSAYENWEKGVRDWLQKQAEKEGIVLANEVPPTEYDDIHTEINKPAVFIVSPSNGQTITSPIIDASVSASAARGVARVEYYLDNTLLSAQTVAPFNLHYFLSSYFVRGYHKLRVRALDDVENSNEAEIELNLLVDLPKPGVIWQFPQTGATFSAGNFPLNMAGQLTDRLASRKVNLLQRKVATGETVSIATIIFPDSDYISVGWGKPAEAGEYEIYAEIIDGQGNHFESGRLNVVVQ